MTTLVTEDELSNEPTAGSFPITGEFRRSTAGNPLSYLIPKSLLVRIVLLFSVAVSVGLLTIAQHIVRQETEVAQNELHDRVRVLAQTMSALLADDTAARDYTALETHLLSLAQLKEISRLTISDGTGEVLADISRNGVGGIGPRYGTPNLTPPLSPVPSITFTADRGTAWYPIMEGGLQGWLTLEYSLDAIKAADKRIWHDVAINGALALFFILIILVMVLWRPILVVGRATAFADRLRDGQGEQMDIIAGSKEISGLQTALNRASRQLHTQRHELIKTANRLIAFLDYATEAVITIDEKGLITSFNRSAASMFGYSTTEAIGNNVAILVPEPDRSSHDGYIETYLRTGEKKILGQSREVHAQRQDGSTFQAELTISEIHSDGKRYFLGLARDISDRKRAEELSARLGRILEESSNEIYVFDAKSLFFIQANRSARENLGYTMDELRQLRPYDIKLNFDQMKFVNKLTCLRNDSTKNLLFETEHLRKDGTVYPVEIRLQFFENESPPVFVAIVQDVTRRRLAEEEFRQAQKMESIGHLTSGVAHEFNNMLNAVGGFAHLIKREADNPDLVREWIEEVISASEQAASLTSQLLSFSRKHPLKERVLVVGDFVAGHEKLLGSVVEKAVEAGRQIDLDFDVSDRNCRIKTDPAQLSQVLLNLAINARDAMPEGGRIQIGNRLVDVDREFAELRAGATPGRFAMIFVQDTGLGIAPEDIARIFDPFFTTKAEGEGTGLGLSMVHGMVHQSGGFLDAESQVGKGTAIKIFLPAVDEEATPDEEDIRGF